MRIYIDRLTTLSSDILGVREANDDNEAAYWLIEQAQDKVDEAIALLRRASNEITKFENA
jgi:hypothetical protein